MLGATLEMLASKGVERVCEGNAIASTGLGKDGTSETEIVEDASTSTTLELPPTTIVLNLGRLKEAEKPVLCESGILVLRDSTDVSKEPFTTVDDSVYARFERSTSTDGESEVLVGPLLSTAVDVVWVRSPVATC